MITTNDFTTSVKFGNNEKANISVGAKKGMLTLQMLATQKQIGDTLVDEDIQELPKVEIEFFTIESLDVVIHMLEVIRRNYTPPPSWSSLALAC